MQQPPKLFILPLTVHFPKGFVGFSVSLPALRRRAIEHIAPLGSCEFTEDYRKIGAFCRVDVGIDPYKALHGQRLNVQTASDFAEIL